MLIVTTAEAGRKKPGDSSIRERVENQSSRSSGNCLWIGCSSRSWQGLWNTIRLTVVAQFEARKDPFRLITQDWGNLLAGPPDSDVFAMLLQGWAQTERDDLRT